MKRRSLTPESTKALRAFQPDWCLFWPEKVRAWQFDIWFPYIRRSRYRFAVAASANVFPDAVRDRVASLPNCVIVEDFAEGMRCLGTSPGLRGFLYTSGKRENLRVIDRFRRASHVWLGHGESEKRTSGFRMAMFYDSVLVADYRAVGRFHPAMRAWVALGACAIGAPIVEGVEVDARTRPRPIRTILYAPTWEGHSDSLDYSSLPDVAPILAAQLPELMDRGITMIVRPHPATGLRLPDRNRVVERLFASGAVRAPDKAQAFRDADIMIGDVSGVMAEFLFTQSPAVIPVSRRLTAVGKSEDLLADAYPWVYRWDPGRRELVDLLAEIETRDPLDAARSSMARRVFRDHRSLDDAAASFDLALGAASWRKRGVPPRLVYETRQLLWRLRGRSPPHRDDGPERVDGSNVR
ncbi:MAG: CDP-glycerol glycerophosphotransferase family protein [Chloroflexi bacterium]|nr:CDP-glycerol glycerophosphotransferase family protein [Chloroflexota bacterium]